VIAVGLGSYINLRSGTITFRPTAIATFVPVMCGRKLDDRNHRIALFRTDCYSSISLIGMFNEIDILRSIFNMHRGCVFTAE